MLSSSPPHVLLQSKFHWLGEVGHVPEYELREAVSVVRKKSDTVAKSREFTASA